MVTSLRDIPAGSDRPQGRRHPRDAWHGFEDAPRPTVLLNPRESLGRPPLRPGRLAGWDERRRRRLSPLDALLALAVIAVVLFLGRSMWSATRVHVTSTGLDRHDALTYGETRHLDVHIVVRPRRGLETAKLTLDGKPVADAERVEDGFRWRPDGPLTAREHELKLVVPRAVLPASTFSWKFV